MERMCDDEEDCVVNCRADKQELKKQKRCKLDWGWKRSRKMALHSKEQDYQKAFVLFSRRFDSREASYCAASEASVLFDRASLQICSSDSPAEVADLGLFPRTLKTTSIGSLFTPRLWSIGKWS
jgi:hypothetical protein